MAKNGFCYLSPREFDTLGPIQKKRYLSALFEQLHGPSSKVGAPETAQLESRSASRRVPRARRVSRPPKS